MALFGKPKPKFAPQPTQAATPPFTPGNGPGLGAVQPERKPGLGTRLFGKGWEDKAYALGGLLQGDQSGVMMMRQNEQAAQQAMAQEQAAQLKRAQDLADWRYKQEWERDNPKPVNNDTVADYEFIRGKLGEEQAQTYLRNRADPPQYRQGPDGRFYRIETGVMPTAPVGALRPYQPKGGPVSNGGGGF